eukprot:GSA120T00000860001.1
MADLDRNLVRKRERDGTSEEEAYLDYLLGSVDHDYEELLAIFRAKTDSSSPGDGILADYQHHAATTAISSTSSTTRGSNLVFRTSGLPQHAGTAAHQYNHVLNM